MKIRHILALVAVLGATAACLLVSDVKVKTGLLIFSAILLWATMALPEYITSLLFIAAALILSVAPPDVVFSGFSSKAVWLVFAGIVFGVAVQQHGLGGNLFQKLGLLRLSYVPLIWTLAAFAALLAFVLPSAVGRILILAPLAKLLCDELELGETANERFGIYLTIVIGTTLPAFAILTSNVPNIVLLGTVETVLGFSFTYPQYFGVNFPVLGFGTFLLTTTMILRAFPGALPARAAASSSAPTEPVTPEQMRLAAILLTTLALWISEELHGVPAAWVGLAMALVALMPRIGVLEPHTLTKLNLGPWFFLAGVIAVGAIARQNGVADLVWASMSSLEPFANLPEFLRYMLIVIFNVLLGLLATLPAAPSIFVSLIPSIADTTGWTQQAVAFATVPSFIFFAFPYQAPPILIGTTLLGIPARTAMRVMVPVFLTGHLVLTPLHYLWGRFIGVFP